MDEQIEKFITEVVQRVRSDFAADPVASELTVGGESKAILHAHEDYIIDQLRARLDGEGISIVRASIGKMAVNIKCGRVRGKR